MEHQINITPTGSELIIREGKAPEIRDPRPINLSCDIHTVANFLSKGLDRHSLQKIEADRVVVEVDKNGRTIKLHLDPENHFGGLVVGVLTESDELKQFNINTATVYNREQFVKLIKFSRMWFDSKEEHQKLLDNIQKLQIKTESEIQQEKSNRGNVNNTFIKKVNGDIPQWFALNVPLFKGFDPVRFMVEICLDVTEGQARFWLESTELHEIVTGQIDSIFAKELESCKDFVTIYK